MRAKRAGKNRIRIPVVSGGSDATAHSTEEIGPDDPRYAAYDRWLHQQEEEKEGKRHV